MININDASQYKRCQKKKYNVWVCMPPIGTCVINKLEQAQVVKQFNGRTYFTAAEMRNLHSGKKDAYEFLLKNAYIVDANKRFVLSGTQGEMWTIDANKLAKTYVFAGNANRPDEDINNNSLKARLLSKKVNSESVMNWQLLETRTVRDSNFACQVPANEVFTINTSWGSILTGNDPTIPHGKGDFVMCPANPDNTPNLNDRWIVNGLIFGDTYDNRGWSQNVVSNGETNKFLEKPKALFSVDAGNNEQANETESGSGSKESNDAAKNLLLQSLIKLVIDENGKLGGKLKQFTGHSAIVKKVTNSNYNIIFGRNNFEDSKNPYEQYAILGLRDDTGKNEIQYRYTLATFNSKGKVYSQDENSVIMKLKYTDGEVNNIYNYMCNEILTKLDRLKVEERDTRSNKEKANDILNIFGKKSSKKVENTASANISPSKPAQEPIQKVENTLENTDKTKKNKKMYQMVARCTDGFKVTGYMLKSTDNSEPARKFSRQQTYFLIGKKLVINCDGKISKDGVSLSGVGTKITDLPMVDENGSIRNAEHTGHVRRGDKAEDIINRNMIVGIVKNGRSTDGYILKGAGGATSFCSKDDVYRLAQERKIGNVSAQLYNGKLLIRSIPGQPSLSSLPIMDKSGNIIKDKVDYKKRSSKVSE